MSENKNRELKEKDLIEESGRLSYDFDDDFVATNTYHKNDSEEET